MSSPLTSLILNFLSTYSVFEVRHILFNQPNDSTLWASPPQLTPLTHIRTLTLSQTTSFRLFHTERVGRRQFQIG